MLPALLLLFFVSGACGLVYQQLWLRELSLVFGVTLYAVATVLAAFFSGLALGSFLAGRYADRARSPLLGYAVVEILVGVLALATPVALGAVERAYVNLAALLPDSTALVTVVRFILSFAVLLIPATLLGASLPMIVKSSLGRSGGLGERVSLLYATNTAGAIAGTLAAGFWMIRSYGVLTSFRAAAAGNIVVGVVALLMSATANRRRNYVSAPEASPASAMQTPLGSVAEPARRVVLVVFTVSGLVALGLEVVWFRILVLYLDSNTYAFTIMLATVLAGISAGSYLAAPLMRWAHRSLVPLAVAELAIALAALLSVYLLAQTYDVADSIGRFVGSTSGTNLRFMLLASALAILPTTVLMGLAFPIGLYIFARKPEGDDRDVGRSVGTFYACNVAGGIVGSLLAGFVLVPELGTRRSVIVLATILLGSGLALTALAGGRRVRVGVAAGATALFVALAALAVPEPYQAALDDRYAGEHVLWFDEGEQTTVSIHESRGERFMYLDGLIQADDSKPVVRYHTRIGSLPTALHPQPKRALVIGLGGGVTAGAVGAQPGLDVDVVELSASVVQGAAFLSDVNHDVVRQHNVSIRVDDARNYLLVTDKRYDVITADIIQPQHAGAGKLWSVEYWQLARDALDDDGIMLQWVPYRRPAEYKMILRSFLKVFPDATLWSKGSMLVGTKKPLGLKRSDFERKLATPENRSILAASGVTSFESLLALYTAGPAEIRAFVGSGPLLTDDRPRIEYSSDSEPSTVLAPSFISNLNGDVSDILG